MNLKIATRNFVAILAMALICSIAVPHRADARPVTKAEQLVFYKNFYPMTVEICQEYQIPWELAMAQFAWESSYGTGPFVRSYHNISGYDCYLDGGQVVCHEGGHYASFEECIRDYCRLIADTYGFRGSSSAEGIVASMGVKYSGGSPNYVRNITGMIATARRLEGETVAALEADEQAAKEAEAARTAELMAKLADEEIYLVKLKTKVKAPVAGAVAVANPKAVVTAKVTVAEAAEMVTNGEFRDKRIELAGNYDKVMKYHEYISLPGQS